MSCLSCWTCPQQESFPPFFSFLPLPLLSLSACISLLRCQTRPLTLQSIAQALFLFPRGSLSPASPLSHHSLPPFISSFSHFLLILFMHVFFFFFSLNKPKEHAADLHALASDWLTLLLIPCRFVRYFLFPQFLHPLSLFLSVSFDPTVCSLVHIARLSSLSGHGATRRRSCRKALPYRPLMALLTQGVHRGGLLRRSCHLSLCTQSKMLDYNLSPLRF